MSDSNTKIDFSGIDFGVQAEEYAPVEKKRTFLKGTVMNAARTAFKGGMGKEYLQHFSRIIKKIEVSDDLVISFAPHELKLVEDCFSRATWDPGAHALVCQLFALIDEARKPKVTAV